MKLKKKYFNEVKIGEQCLYKNMHGEVIYCQKIGNDIIFCKKEKRYTGQFHSCYLIGGLNIIERFFAKFQWYLKRKWEKENGI